MYLLEFLSDAAILLPIILLEGLEDLSLTAATAPAFSFIGLHLQSLWL